MAGKLKSRLRARSKELRSELKRRSSRALTLTPRERKIIKDFRKRAPRFKKLKKSTKRLGKRVDFKRLT